MSVGTYWPWEPTATLRSALRRRGRLGGARRFGAQRGRRGAGTYCGGRTPTACLIERYNDTGKIDRRKSAADRDLQERQQTFIESENWPPNSSDLNPVDYSVWGRGIATDGVMSHTFKH